MRFGVVVYLVLVAVAGPWVCCCTAAFTDPSARNQNQATPASCCRAAERENQAPNRAPLLPDRPCSCNDERPLAVLSAGAVPAVELALALSCQAADVLPNQFVMVDAVGSVRSTAVPLQGLTDILHLSPILRC